MQVQTTLATTGTGFLAAAVDDTTSVFTHQRTAGHRAACHGEERQQTTPRAKGVRTWPGR